jgi:hypothetical protein
MSNENLIMLGIMCQKIFRLKKSVELIEIVNEDKKETTLGEWHNIEIQNIKSPREIKSKVYQEKRIVIVNKKITQQTTYYKVIYLKEDNMLFFKELI